MYKCEKCNKNIKTLNGLKNHLNRKISCENQPKKCLNPDCSNQIKYPNKFCSSKCSGKVNSTGKKHSEETKIKISIGNGGNGILSKNSCLNCGNPTYIKFCNMKCKNEYESNKLILEWLDGKISGSQKDGHYTMYVKKYLFKKHNYKCSKCGWGEINPYSKIIPLQVHHKDGNRKNNNPNNVDLLCPNCHSLTETYNLGDKRKYSKKIKRISNSC